MRNLIVIFVLCITAQAATTYYVDPAYVGGGSNGSITNPWTSLASGWATINTSLASGPVTVYFSATASTTAAITLTSRTNSSSNVLTLDGSSFKNTNETTPNWVVNATPAPCVGENCAKNASWMTGPKFTISASTPIQAPSGPSDKDNCLGFFTIQGFNLANSAGQTANLAYIHDLIFQYNEGHRTGVGDSTGPGIIAGPAQHGPCNGDTSNVGGPDNVTIQYNYIHATWGECIYIGASTSDPPGGPGSAEYAANAMTCGTACNTGKNYLIKGNTVESCASWGGQGDGSDIKDGHANLQVIGNTYKPSLPCTGCGSNGPGNDGQGIPFESGALIQGNYIEAPGHDGIAIFSSWNNGAGRSALTVADNIIVNIKSGIGHNGGIDQQSPSVAAIWGPLGIYNNSIFLTNDPCIEIESGNASGSATIENNIVSSCGSGGITGGSLIALHDYNDCFGTTGCPVETHGITSNPSFVSTATPYFDTNFKVQSGSPTIGAATNLFSSLTTDYLGNAWPSVGPWDMGAFRSSVAPPAIPTNLVAIVNGLGGPNYPGSSQSAAALGTISSPFSSATLFNSTAFGPLNTVTDCITRFTDQNIVVFGTNASGTGTLNAGGTTYTGSGFSSNWQNSLITINAQTVLITVASSSSLTLSPAVTGGPGTFAYSFAGINLDNGISQGSFSSSGGWNDGMGNNGNSTTLIGVRANSGVTWIFNVTKLPNGCFQNSTNGGENPNLSFGGPFGWSRKLSAPTLLYHMQNNHILTPETITVATPMTNVTGTTFDFDGCPGVANIVPPGTAGTSGSILGRTLNDTAFSVDISWGLNGLPGGQGTGHQAILYTPNVGCKVLDLAPSAFFSGTASIVANVATVTTAGQPNMPAGFTAAITSASNTNFNCANATITAQGPLSVSYTCNPALTNTASTTLTTGLIVGNFGNIYPNCLTNCATVAPTAQETTCFDNLYYTGSPNGIHDLQVSLDGRVVRIAGGCNNLGSGTLAFWDTSTNLIFGSANGTSTWSPGNGFNIAGHNSEGVTHFLTTNDPIPNIRIESPATASGLSNFTQLTPFPSAATATGGAHGGWAHPSGDDSFPWIIGTGNSTGFSTPGQMTLSYLENEIWAEPTGAALPIIRLVPTYNTTLNGGFACQNTIGFVFQPGDGVAWLGDGFQNLGLDSQGQQLCSVFVAANQ